MASLVVSAIWHAYSDGIPSVDRRAALEVVLTLPSDFSTTALVREDVAFWLDPAFLPVRFVSTEGEGARPAKAATLLHVFGAFGGIAISPFITLRVRTVHLVC